jgi:ATP-dependent Lon protease
MAKDRAPRKLSAEDVDLSVDAGSFGFESTSELEPLDEIVGQPRALEALELGLGIPERSYNIYVAGLSGMGRKQMIRRTLAERVERKPTPPDWIYVFNFEDTDRPLAISLPDGTARRLETDLEELLDHLTEELPKSFEQEELRKQKQRLNREFQSQMEEAYKSLEALAREKSLSVQQFPPGHFALVPLKDGRPMTEEEVQAMPDEERASYEKRGEEIAEHVQAFMRQQRDMHRRHREELKQIDKAFAGGQIAPLVEDLAGRYDSSKLQEWFGQLKNHMIENWQQFHPDESPEAREAVELLGLTRTDRFLQYRVNVLVDNSNVEGVPVIIEESPNYKNLFGIVDREVDRLGHVTTDFTQIKAGSLLRANGGYVLFSLTDALMEPAVWKELKRTIQRGSLQVEMYEPMGMFSMASLRPEPIPLDVKLVVLGNPLVYHLLYLWDEDFRQIFKVKAEFAPDMERDDNVGKVLGRLLEKIRVKEDSLLPFRADAVAELVRAACRMAGHRTKLTAEFSRLNDLAREASYMARRQDHEEVTPEAVREAIDAGVFRSNLLAERIREMIREGVLRIDVSGRKPGQVNGLPVANLGDYAFGRPSRLTASIGVGSAGLINIERESKLSGETYDKGMMILEGYLRNRYSSNQALVLSASLTMEQSYGIIDGDSASAAELYCLLSALAETPLRQEVAITGSINQWGEVQAVGAVNEKIEGFYDVCRELGLTGEQGVMIPAANVRHLVLRPDVVEAIRDEQFHVWAVDHIDEGIELLSGLPAGKPHEEQSFHGRVFSRLSELAAAALEQQTPPGEGERQMLVEVREKPEDPRPPLPGGD